MYASVHIAEFLRDGARWDMWALDPWLLLGKNEVCQVGCTQNDLSYRHGGRFSVHVTVATYTTCSTRML